MLERILERIIEEKKLTIRELSKKINVPASTISSIKNGESCGKIATIDKIIEGLEIDSNQADEIWEAWSLKKSKGKIKKNSEIQKLKKITSEEIEILKFFSREEIVEMFERELAQKSIKAMNDGEYNDKKKEFLDIKNLIKKLQK